jgi:peroxiredoxin
VLLVWKAADDVCRALWGAGEIGDGNLGHIEESTELSARLGLPYPLLSDPEGRAIERYTYWGEEGDEPLPSLFVIDRYGTLHYQCITQEVTELPEGEEILSWLNFIQSQCPECSI